MQFSCSALNLFNFGKDILVKFDIAKGAFKHVDK